METIKKSNSKFEGKISHTFIISHVFEHNPLFIFLISLNYLSGHTNLVMLIIKTYVLTSLNPVFSRNSIKISSE